MSTERPEAPAPPTREARQEKRSLEAFDNEGGARDARGEAGTAAPRPARGVSSDALIGRTVLAAGGQALGAVVGFQIDPVTWRVEAIEVKLHRDVDQLLGIHRRVLRPTIMKVPTGMIQSVGDAFILSGSVDVLRRQQSDAAASSH